MGGYLTVPDPDGFTVRYSYVCDRCGRETDSWIEHADEHAREDGR